MDSSIYWQGVWRLADPKISLASFAGMFMASCFAGSDVGLSSGWLVLTVIGIFFIEVGKNASGEVVDYDSGTDLRVADRDRSPFSGGKRVMVDGLLTREQTQRIAMLCYSLGITCGVMIGLLRDVRIMALGAVGVGLAWFYHGGTLRLSYRGFGELAVALAYGPLIVNGTYLVQAGYLSAPLLHASMSLGLLVAAFLWINQFPDYEADLASGKRNLVVRLGRERAAFAYVVLTATGYLWLFFAAWQYPAAQGMLLGLSGLPLSCFAAVRLLGCSSTTSRIIPAQAASLAAFVTLAVGTGLGYTMV